MEKAVFVITGIIMIVVGLYYSNYIIPAIGIVTIMVSFYIPKNKKNK